MAEKFQYSREWTDEKAFPLLSFSKNWENPEDYPTYEPDETQVRKDMQSLHDEVKNYLNDTLIPAVLTEDATEEDRKQAEAARVAAEQGRVTAEEGRVSAETARGNAESQRASAETTRVGNETARNQGETTRVAAENARINAEMNRNQAEQNRAHSETARDQAETARRNSENIRATSETERAQAERNRVSAENNRVSAEASRSQGEAARKSAESTRQANETVRQNAESARQTAETNRAQTETARNVWEDYDSAKNYQPGNKVYWQGSSYVCLKPCSGISPENGTYWQLVVRSGFTSDSAFGFDVVNGRLLCYYSGDNPPPFRLGNDGHLYVDLDKTYDLGKVTGGSGGGGSVSMRVDGGYIQYSADGGGTWANLIAVADIKGEPGTPGKNGVDGAPGKDGADGKTPVRGTDYWTDADKQEIINSVIAALPDGTEVSY